MTPAARLAAAIEALDFVWAESGAEAPPADRVLDGYFRARRYIGSKDRNAVAERVFGVLRRRARPGRWVGGPGKPRPGSAPGRPPCPPPGSGGAPRPPPKELSHA